MADLDLYDEAPEFGVERHDSGEVELTIRAEGTRIRITIGRSYDNASLLGESLRHLADDVAEDIVDRWEDLPDEDDGYISFNHGRYHVSLVGKPVGAYLSREVAEIELARAMVAGGVFPNAWFITDHGNYAAIDDHIRRWHDEGGTGMASLAGVQYQPGDRVWYVEMDWPCVVLGDWGPAGVEVHPVGDPTIRTHVTDRAELRPITE